MKVLIIGGTGLISQGIVKHLLARGAQIAALNRGRRDVALPDQVQQITGDRNDPTQLRQSLDSGKFDVVIDMVCFDPRRATEAADVFAGQCEQFIFCSTVCAYGVKTPPKVFIDETFPSEPISSYGKNKLECERILLAAHEAGKFKTTVIRPSHTYGPGAPLIDNLESDPVAWDRITRGEPVLCAGDGLGLWVSTHRDDCGKAFAYAAMNPKSFGQMYNATQRQHITWREYYRIVADTLGKKANLLFMPASWIAKHDPARFGLLREITAFHGAYDSSKAEQDMPQYRCEIPFEQGARQTLEDAWRRGAWKQSAKDPLYQKIVDAAQATGVEPIEV